MLQKLKDIDGRKLNLYKLSPIKKESPKFEKLPDLVNKK